MGQTAIIKDPDGNVVTVKIRGVEAPSFRIGDAIQIPGKASTPANWAWPEMPASVDATGRNVLAGHTCEITDDPPPAPPPPPVVLTKRQTIERMLSMHGLTLADLKSELTKTP